MGNLSCCFKTNDPEEDVSTSTHDQNCYCPKCIIDKLFGMQYLAVCNEQQNAPTSSTAQLEPPPLSSDHAVSNNAQSNNMFSSAPRIIHAAAIRSNQKQDGQIREEDNDQVDMEVEQYDSKGNKSSKSELKFSSDKSDAEVEVVPICESLEDEDVCPTCLEEYIPENPKIVLQCSHDYHLSCIYEWLERSENCPVCGKRMVFDEAA